MALSLAERGLYITACAMIYEAGGPIRKADLRIAAGGRSDSFGLHLLKLVDKGKLQLQDGMIDQVRCEREIARATRRVATKMTKRSKSVANPSVLSSSALNENNDITVAYARAKDYQANKEEESKPKPSESVAAREEDSKSESGLWVATLPLGQPEPAPEAIAEVGALVEHATATLNGRLPKGVRDAVAYQVAVKENKFINLVKKLNAWVGTGLDGGARFAAWEVLAAAERAGARNGMSRAARRNLDKIDEMYKAANSGKTLEVAA